LWEKFHVKLIRRSLSDVATRGTLHPDTKHITIDGYPVSVFYLRAGYSPEDHPTENEWTARLMMERSTAIVCPNIRYHLCGTKKMQQVWATPGILERYLSAEKCQLLRTSFAGIYSLDPKDNPEEIIAKAIASPDSYVMKPQREGGGNLLFREGMVEALTTMTPEERSAYIVMDRINPPSEKTYFCRRGVVEVKQGVSELGTFGLILAEDGIFHINEFGGLLLRTKAEGAEDGGVCSGVAFLNSIVLTTL